MAEKKRTQDELENVQISDYASSSQQALRTGQSARESGVFHLLSWFLPDILPTTIANTSLPDSSESQSLETPGESLRTGS